MSEFVLEMKNISKSFPGTRALSDVNFGLKAGEVHALIGENGAGKSTLMNILIGIHKMDEGEILLYGSRVFHADPYVALKNGVGIVPQELNLVPDMTVAENVFLNNERKKGFGRIDWIQTIQDAQRILGEMEIDMDVTQRLSKLSPAFQQLVSIARLLSFGTQILILDEPTACLTVSETEMMFKILSRLRAEGKSIIFITHHLEEVKEICDNVTIMRDSRVVYVSPVNDLSIDDMIFYMANRKIEKNIKEHREVSGDVILEVQGLTREREFTNASFQVKRGEIFGVAGLVGAGRTELFNCIFGITKAKEGAVTFDGVSTSFKIPHDAIARGIGLVPEERRKMGIFPVLSVAENMLLPSYAANSNAGVIQHRSIHELAEKFSDNLHVKSASIQTQIKNLSGGNQQKVIIARWMAMNVRLLILDEPTRGIDVNAKGEIHRLIKEMAYSGVTVIVISSELEEVISLADRIMVMHEGHIKGFVEDLHEIRQEDILKIALTAI